jgi:diguanylate cyclase (GGDEF)-like protein/PAS domain S-box-containing protein
MAAMFAWQQRAKPSATPMVILSLAAGFWSICYYFEYNATDLATKVVWSQVKYPALTVLPIALSSFMLRFAGWHTWPNKQLLAVLLIIPILTTLIVFTNESHHFFWTSHELIQHPGYVEIRSARGPWYWVNVIFIYGLILSAAATAISLLARTWRIYQKQVILLGIGISLPLVISIITLLRAHPWPGIDLSPITFGLTAIFLLFTTRLTSILNVVPLAHANLVEQMRDGVLVVDKENRILEVNGAAEKILSVTKQDVIGKSTASLDHPAIRLVTNALSGKTARHEIEIKNGELSNWYDVRISAIRATNDEIAGYMAIWHNITERKQIEHELRHTATHDPLTSVYNRMYFDEVMESHTYDHHWPVTVMSVDLDNLKETNDQLGHAAGDELIRQTAAILRKTFRQNDLVARIGGDEFAILVMQSDEDTATMLMQRLREMAAQYNAAAPRVPLKFSAGYAIAYHTDELPAAMAQADQRMYTEKGQHKGNH